MNDKTTITFEVVLYSSMGAVIFTQKNPNLQEETIFPNSVIDYLFKHLKNRLKTLDEK